MMLLDNLQANSLVVIYLGVFCFGISILIALWSTGFFEDLEEWHWAIIVLCFVVAIIGGYYYGSVGYR